MFAIPFELAGLGGDRMLVDATKILSVRDCGPVRFVLLSDICGQSTYLTEEPYDAIVERMRLAQSTRGYKHWEERGPNRHSKPGDKPCEETANAPA